MTRPSAANSSVRASRPRRLATVTWQPTVARSVTALVKMWSPEAITTRRNRAAMWSCRRTASRARSAPSGPDRSKYWGPRQQNPIVMNARWLHAMTTWSIGPNPTRVA